MFKDQVFQFMALPFGISLSMDFHQTNGCNSSALTSTCHLVVSVPRRLAYKRSNSQQTSISHNILPSNCAKSRVHSKSKEVRFDTSPEIHVYRDGISDTTKHRVPADGIDSLLLTILTIRLFLSQTQSFGMNFPFSFGQAQCSGIHVLRSPRQTSFTAASNVTSYSSSQSSGSDQQYDSIPFEMVDGHQWLCSRNIHLSSRSQYIPFYGCQSFWMGSSSRADETILSWSLVGRPIPAPYQYSGNNGHLFHTEENHKIHTPLLCHDFY